MSQAIHIFLKDARRLGLQIAVLVVAIAYFAAGEIRLTPRNAGGPTGFPMIELIVGAAVWRLIAQAVHEESLAGANEFWLTRPYARRSLFGAKIMMVMFAVVTPLFVADCVILALQSLPIGSTLGGLILRQLLIATWLILPPFAVASVTRSIREDVMIWVALLALGGLTYFPGAMNASNDFRAANEKYALAVAFVLIVAAIWRQYLRRGFFLNRTMVAAALLLPALPFPESMALAIEQLRNSPGTSNITMAAAANRVEEEPNVGYNGDNHCAPIPLTIGGVNPGWRLAVLSQNDSFESDGKTWSTGWHQSRPGASDFSHIPAGSVSACVGTAKLRELGVEKPLAVQVSIALAVFAPQASIRVPASLAPFEVRGIGWCQFRPYLQTNHVLSCKAPVWFPPAGHVAVTGSDAWSSPIAGSDYPWLPLNLLPGLSPVYKWITMPMDDGSAENASHPLNAWFGLNNLIRAGGQIEFVPEQRIAVLRRDVDVKQVRFRRQE